MGMFLDTVKLAEVKAANLKRRYQFKRVSKVSKARFCRDCRKALAISSKSKYCLVCIGASKFDPPTPKLSKCRICKNNTVNRYHCAPCLVGVEQIHNLDSGCLYGSRGSYLNRYDFKSDEETPT